jgi:hypothetical protein
MNIPCPGAADEEDQAEHQANQAYSVERTPAVFGAPAKNQLQRDGSCFIFGVCLSPSISATQLPKSMPTSACTSIKVMINFPLHLLESLS